MSISWWMDRTSPFHRLEYYTPLKRREALTPTTMCVVPENTMLSDRSKHRRTHRV